MSEEISDSNKKLKNAVLEFINLPPNTIKETIDNSLLEIMKLLNGFPESIKNKINGIIELKLRLLMLQSSLSEQKDTRAKALEKRINTLEKIFQSKIKEFLSQE